MENWNAMSDDAFRSEARRFIEQNYPEELRFVPRPRWALIKPWVMKLVEKGWSAPAWPVEYGGMGLSPRKLLIFTDELGRWGCARTPDHGIIQIGLLIIHLGTEEQKRTLLPGMRTFETIWCQGYSEPNAGSDLASLSTEAVLDGDEFVINGGKIWTSAAFDATHMYMLARTDKKAKKQDGISFLLLDMRSPGVTVREIKNISGIAEFCEVHFQNVRTARSNLVGELNKGWTVAKSLLGFERLNAGSPRRAQFAFRRLEDLARERGLFEDAGFREQYTRLRLDVADLNAVYSYFFKQFENETLGPDLSVLKILSSETFQRITEFMLEASGDLGLMTARAKGGDSKVNVLAPFLRARAITISAGSVEIQRNILARQVLKLPV